MYVVDIVRRHTHPHNWIMNTPVFGLWLIDRAIVGNLWRRTQPQIYCKTLSEDYMLISWCQASSLQARAPLCSEPG